MATPRKPLRRMSLFDLTVAGAAFIAPAFSLSAIFYLIALDGGRYAPEGVILGALAALLVALSFAEMSKYYPKAGGAYSMVEGEISRGAGFVAGWGLAILYFLGPAIPLLLVVTNLAILFPSLLSSLVPLTVFVAAAVLIVNLVGLRPSIRVAFLFFLAEAAILVGIAIVLFSKPEVPATAVAGGSWGILTAIGNSAVWTVFLFLGFDSVATYSEEANVPLRDVSKGTVYALGIAAAIYLLSTLAYVWAIPQGQWLGSSGLLTPVGGVLGADGGTILSIVILTSSLGVLIAVENACARVFFAMGRDGVLPSQLTRLVGKANTPGVPLALSAIATAAMVVVAVVLGIDATFSSNGALWFLLEVLPSMLVLGALIAYFLVSLAGAKRMFTEGKRPRAIVPMAAMGVTAALAIFEILPGSFSLPVVAGVLLWFAGGLAVWGVSFLLQRRPDSSTSPLSNIEAG